jgi:hypothetical protein
MRKNIEDLKAAIITWLDANHFRYGVTFYSREEWRQKGHTNCEGAYLVMLYDGSPLYGYFNYPGDHEVALRDELDHLVEKFGYWYEQEYAWLCGFYAIDEHFGPTADDPKSS